MDRQDEVRSWLRLVFRDIGAPSLGIFVVLHETLFVSTNRPWLLVLGATLLGYPIADRVDTWIRKNGGGKESSQ